jgi:hypothetical protein
MRHSPLTCYSRNEDSLPLHSTQFPVVFRFFHGRGLEAFRAGDGTPKGGAKVINIGCSATSSGRLDYFDRDHGRNGRRPGTALSPPFGVPSPARKASSNPMVNKKGDRQFV